MRKRKFIKSSKENKKVYTIIEIRKEILYALSDKSENLDREIYTSAEIHIIRRELKSIAEMVRDKDMLMAVAMGLKKISRKSRVKPAPLISDIRQVVIDILHKKKDSITVSDYDRIELPIVEKELEDIEMLIVEKDRIKPTIYRDVRDNVSNNIHVNKFFNMDLEPNPK